VHGRLARVLVLLAAGGLLTWASSYVDTQVHDQLAMQDITMPAKTALETPAQHKALDKYAGQQLTTGAQARAYADHYIAVHLDAMAGGKTYSQLSEESRANPEDQKLAGLVATAFKGETLRGLLLNAYAFDTMATVAGIAAVVAFGAAGVMLLLSVLGFVHARRTDDVIELGDRHRATTPAQPVTV
jgi:hypothetical protein